MKYESLTKKVVRISKSLNQKVQNDNLRPSSILTSNFDESILSYVIFRESDTDYFFKRFMKKNFTHCLLLQKHEFGWVMINPTRPFLHIDLLDFFLHEDVPYIIIQQNRSARIIEVITKPHPEKNLFFKPNTCVSMVNYCLGLEWVPFTCITPYQLYRNLLNVRNPNILKVREI